MRLSLVNKSLGRLVEWDVYTWKADCYEGENVRDRSTLSLVAEAVCDEDGSRFLHGELDF